MRLKFLVFPAIFLSAYSNLYAQKSVATGRYESIKTGATPAQINPLLAISTFHFSSKISTVGDAINQVVFPTGYTISRDLIPEAKAVLAMPLPFVNRNIGPISTQEAINVLIGKDVFLVQRDALHRTINFKIRVSNRRAK